MGFAGILKFFVIGVVLLEVLTSAKAEESEKVENKLPVKTVNASAQQIAQESMKGGDEEPVKMLKINVQRPVKTIASGSQQAVKTVKGVLKNPLKVKRPGKPLDSRFFGSRYGTFYKPEDFLSDGNSSSINTTESALRSSPAAVPDSISTPGPDSVKSLKGRKLPPKNYLPVKEPKSRKLVEGVPLSAINLDETIETTTVDSTTTEGTTVTEGLSEATEITSTISATEKDN